MSYDSLIPILQKVGSELTPRDFHHVVNIAFHNHEAAVYDTIHADMQNSLQEQMDLLVSDLKTKFKIESKNLTLLDVGCGTGMSTETLLKTDIGSKITEITLLDSSIKMLDLAQKRSSEWNKKTTVINGYLEKVTTQFDIVLICSVLHHIPDLDTFLDLLETKIKPFGFLIHLQDPNGDFTNDCLLQKRQNEFNIYQFKGVKKFDFRNILPKSFKHYINRKLGRKNYIDNINDDLLASTAIKKRMTADELWSITDIHVPSQTSNSIGISLQYLHQKLQAFTMISCRTYGFFGVLKSDLPADMVEKENSLINSKAQNGRNLGCVWQKH